MENRRVGEIDNMQLAIDENRLLLSEQAKTILSTYELAKKTDVSVNLLHSVVHRHVEKEKDQDKQQKKINVAIDDLNLKLKDLNQRLDVPLKTYEAGANFAIGVQRIRKAVFWLVSTGLGIYALLELWERIKS